MPFSKELMKGAAELIVLQALCDHGESYGYQLVQTIADTNNNIFEMQEGTLYPILYRLESKGLVTSQKRTAPSGKERRYYTITKSGKKVLAERLGEFQSFMRAMKNALSLSV
ncbi:helix-turn-helix transcriptional regulator [Candidatus Uhrbacteria bacterium]|nr:helix-turn-helix transcriptional regulator [Candidatus Uhrbacteria bacterium]